LRTIATILGLAVAAVLVQTLRRDGPGALAAWRSAHVHWGFVALAIGCGFAGHAIYLIGWRRLLTDSDIPVSIWPLARIFFVSNLGRYLPGGKAWQMGIVGIMASEDGLPAAQVAASSLLQGAIGVGTGALVLFIAGGAALGVSGAWLALPVAGIIGVLLVPAIIRSIPAVRAVLVRHVHGIDAITTATMWALVWTSVASWVLWGIALYYLASALLPVPGAPLASYVAAWCGSFLAGLVAVVSPAGLGAREGVIQVVLEKAGMTASDVLLVVVVQRGWVTLMDVVPALVVLMLRRRGQSRARAASLGRCPDGPPCSSSAPTDAVSGSR
jgi:uncharacterized membrane protein YbhN (UPF0104 family)